jgi:AraC family transcriptional regulator of adaptative response / DNA-3-methyladenine glycosylase II
VRLRLLSASSDVRAELTLADPRDRDAALARCRALLDLDADPRAVAAALSGDRVLGRAVRGAPGRRVPGAVDAAELAVRAVLGQQISLAGAATAAGRLVVAHGEPLPTPVGAVTHLFPSAAALAAADPASLRMPRSRARSLVSLSAALAAGDVDLRPGADRARARTELLALPGIGPWTADYVVMRALGDHDVFLNTDLGVRRSLQRAGLPGDPAAAAALAERWRPYRSYAMQYLWALPASDAGD